MKINKIMMLAAFFSLSSVAIGAFGAHRLKGLLGDKQLQWIDTASTYQMYHSLALLVVAVLMMQVGRTRALSLACYCFILGILFFSGSLYILALTEIRGAVYLTPVGGLSFIIGWSALIFGLSSLNNSES